MTATATATATDPMEIVWLDPKDLLAGSNVRKDLGDMKGLIESVRSIGVLQPVLVRPDRGGYTLVAGARRVAAAAEAGRQVPCIVRSDLGDGPRLVAQLAENLRRSDLSAAEEAAGYEQLAAFGLDVGAIAAQVGSATDVVTRGMQLAKSPRSMAVSAKYALHLDDASALVEFEDEPDIIKTLTVCLQGDPDRFPHVLSRARMDRADRLAIEKIRQDLGDVPVLDGNPSWNLRPGQATRLSEVRTPAGARITPAKHRKCPGHAAWIGNDGRAPIVIWACADPVANGHQGVNGPAPAARATGPNGEGPLAAAAADASAERKLVIANNKAWRAAEPVRQAWLAELYARATPPKTALRYVVNAVLGDPRLLHEHGRDLKDKDLAAALAVPDARLPGLLLRLVCEAMERSLSVDAWRRPPRGTADFLEYLASIDYPLSEVERVAITACRKAGR